MSVIARKALSLENTHTRTCARTHTQFLWWKTLIILLPTSRPLGSVLDALSTLTAPPLCVSVTLYISFSRHQLTVLSLLTSPSLLGQGADVWHLAQRHDMHVDGINISLAMCIVWRIQLLKTESGNYTLNKPDTPLRCCLLRKNYFIGQLPQGSHDTDPNTRDVVSYNRT